MDAILKTKARFAGYRVARKMSRHHDGKREVYLSIDPEGEKVVLTVYPVTADCIQASDIDEVRFMEQHQEKQGLATFIESGVTTYRRKRYAYMAQKYYEGPLLEDVLIERGALEAEDCLKVVKILAGAIGMAARFTRGGGHYGISTENVLVRMLDGRVLDVCLIGFAGMGVQSTGKPKHDLSHTDPRFRAPETRKGILGLRSDVYSLGVLAIMIWTGLPHMGTGEFTLAECRERIEYHARRHLSDPLLATLLKATDFSAFNRFATAEKFAIFLQSILKVIGKAEAADLKIADKPHQPQQEAADLKTVEKPGTRKAAQKASSRRRGLDEVAGMADLKYLFRRDFINIVKNPKIAEVYGITPSNCTLLYGPQGCGKTFIAERAAMESGLKYKVVKPSDLGSIYIHGAQKKIAETFAEAEQKAPMILIFDEFDALVPKRCNEMNENQANEVNEMLTQLNNCAERGVYCICTTNRPDMIDPAVMRKGRVDRSIFVSLPDAEARRELFRLELEGRPVEEAIDYDALTNATDNFSCSDIAFIVEEVARRCFEETLEKGTDVPTLITTERLLETARATGPSVSEEQRREFNELKAKMEHRESSLSRKKVGFMR